MHPLISKLLRSLCNCQGKPYPIIVVKGNKKPALKGCSFYWTTPSGKTIVRHPAAYKWPTKYHNSTLRIEVGDKWLEKRGIICL